MNWPSVLALSEIGLVMGFATVFVIPPNLEPLFWLVIFVFSSSARLSSPASPRKESSCMVWRWVW